MHFAERDYRSSIQLWVTPDPWGFNAEQSNFYVFVGNNPVNRTDPNGLQGGQWGNWGGPPSGYRPTNTPGYIGPSSIGGRPLNPNLYETISWMAVDALGTNAVSRDQGFENKMREAIVKAVKDMEEAGIDMTPPGIAATLPAGSKNWRKVGNGIELVEGANAAEAIRELFKKGSGFNVECWGFANVAYYKAILDVIGDEKFNRNFSKIRLLGALQSTRPPLVRRAIPPTGLRNGDWAYFSNPDYKPGTNSMGENAIRMPGRDSYYGNGLGTMSSAQIIAALNASRRGFGPNLRD